MQHILIHGLGQNSASWNQTISYLTDRESVACPDLSVLLKNRKCTYSNLYHVFSKYCDNISQPFNLCGLSLGAVLALNYVIDHPDRVNVLILIAPQYEMPKTLLRMQNIVFSFMPERVFADTGFKKKDIIELTASMKDINFSKDLEHVTVPVLVLCGEKDSVNKKTAKKLTEYIESAELRLIENSGHEVNQDAPEKLAAVMDEFMIIHRQ